MGKVLEKLSSGYRINRAADDAAGLGISEKMRAQIRGNTQAIRNAKDGISMIQTAEGAMDEIHSILQRMRELGVQAANDTNDTAARTSIGTELIQLRQEIDRIANATNFNGQNLLTGALTGTLGGAARSLTSSSATSVGQLLISWPPRSTYPAPPSPAPTPSPTSPGTGQLTLTGPNGQAQTITVSAIAANGSQTLNFTQLGISITLNNTASSNTVTADNIGAALHRRRERHHRRHGHFGAATLQVGANTTAYDVMTVSLRRRARHLRPPASTWSPSGGVDWTSAATIVASNAAAQAFINQIDAAITTLNTRRSDLGAAQNRLEHTVNSLGVAVENLTASESRIRDADIAELSSQLASSTILQQAGTAVLAQANQSAQSVLSLLRG
ncbi:MAG: flagellin [Tepidiforma sp.]|nr:MAG: flagellin [Tepidiforma sp.]